MGKEEALAAGGGGGMARDGRPGGAGTTEEGVARDAGAGVGRPPERLLLRARRPERSQVTF